MKKSHIAGLIMALACGAVLVCAQEGQKQPNRNPANRPDDGFRPPPPHFFHRPPPPMLMVALDVNRDGKLDAQEIANAVEVLRSLDKNGDGELTFEELRPPFPPPRPDFDDEGDSDCDSEGPKGGPELW